MDGKLGRTRSRWQRNFKLVLKHIGCEIVDWIQLGQDTVQLKPVV
jgi:hypothetical protein